MTTNKPHLANARVSTIMKSCSDVETVGKESSHLMCKAAELFIKTLAKEAYEKTNHGKKLDYKHLAEVVHEEERYEFLHDIMPRKITVLEFKRIMLKKQQKLNEESSSDDDDDEDEEDDDENKSSSDVESVEESSSESV